MITLVVGDTKPDIVLEVWDGGEPLASAASQTYAFRLRKPSGQVIEIPLAVLDAASATVGGNFTEGMLNESGPMLGELLVTFSDGRKQHGEEPFEVYVRPEFTEVRA